LKTLYYLLIDTEEIDICKRLGPFVTLSETFGEQLKHPGCLMVKEVKTKIVEER